MPYLTHPQLFGSGFSPKDEAQSIAMNYLGGYTGATLAGYRIDLRSWWAFCHDHDIDVLDAKRFQVEMFGRHMEEVGYARSTIGRRMSTVAGYYQYCESEDAIPRSPARYVRRPKVGQDSTTLGLDRMELGSFLTHARVMSPIHHALACLLGLNGLRVSEVCSTNVEDLGSERGHRTLKIIGKGYKPAIMPLAPRTARSLDMVIGERHEGPVFLHRDVRLDRFAAGRMVRSVARKSGITKKIGPHSLRHSFITAALDAGVPLRDVQIAARHADPRTTTRYDRNRLDLDRHAAYVVCAFVAGSA